MPTIDIAGRTIAYECPVPLEQRQGRQMLFVHGASFHRGVWQAQMAHFANAHTPICLDLAGHGESSGPACETVECHREIVQTFADRMGLRDFVLVGHSMGGAIAQDYVAQHPDDVLALVLVSTSPKFDIPEDMLTAWTASPELYREQEIDVVVAPETGQAVRNRLLAMRDGNPWEVQRADLLACARWDNTERFPAIRHPALLITGAYDSILEGNRAMHRLLPQSELVVLEHSGHMMQVEEPDEVSQAIERFLAKLP